MSKASERTVISHSEACIIIVGHHPNPYSRIVRRTVGIIIPHSGMAIMFVRMKCAGMDLK